MTDYIARLYVDRAHLLKPGERWLTTADTIQEGDAYLPNQEWWEFGGPHVQSPQIGERLPVSLLGYTPKGPVKRLTPGS